MSNGSAEKYLLTVRAWTPGQHPKTSGCGMTVKEAASFSSHRWNVNTNSDLAFASVGQDNVGQTCYRKVPAVTTPGLPHNSTVTQGSCPRRSGEALELSQGWLEELLPSNRWIRWKIATYGYFKYWEGVPVFLREPTIRGQTMYPTRPSEELLYVPSWEKEFETLSLFHPSPSGDWLL